MASLSARDARGPTVAVVSGPLTPVALGPYSSIVPGSQMVNAAPSRPLHIVLTLPLSNQSALSAFLTALSNPTSPVYHHYLTAAEFATDFAPSLSSWNAVMDFLSSYDLTNMTTTPDRVTIAFDATPATLDLLFHTTIEAYQIDGKAYVAPSTAPELPSSMATALLQVDGLNTYSQYVIRTLGSVSAAPSHHAVPLPPASAGPASNYLPPATYDGAQLEYAPDFQVAADELSLFQQYGFPTNATVATILWSGSYTGGSTVSTPCGTLTNNENVGPWVPADIYDFYNETLPAGQPHSALTAVPINGAPPPSCLASWDSTGAYGENTLDLEMVGSTAPGARIYNVYGPSADTADLDQAFGTILSPPTTLPPAVQSGLDNVTVISNSWGGSDGNDSGWYQDLEQAQARGISVLASSGDSDDSTHSPDYTGTTVDFPSSMAYDSFGDTAVGGTTVVLNPTTLQFQSQVVWNQSGPYGSTGGISTVFPEPSWQQNTAANSVIKGAGRGVPDIAAIANNTLVTISVDGYQYLATNASNGGGFEYFAGTSVASPLTAGLVAEIDHVLRATNNPLLGFLNPTLYTVANDQYATLPSAYPGIGAEATGPYTYSLATAPFYDVTSGSNYLYSALVGYDLVTGWGSLDAYNYTMYVMQVSSSEVAGHLSGVQDRFDLTDLEVSSSGVSYNASTQQNFFLANSLGAPIYWVQNVVYIAGSPGKWQMNFTGWVIFPFWATYPSDAVYEYNWPASGLTLATPVDFNFTTQLENPGTLSADVVFSFGVSGTSALTLPVPGASFVIGSLNYNFSWQGVEYTNGGGAYAPGAGFLSPQFGLVGGPSAGLGNFQSPTAGALSAWVEPWGTSSWVAPLTESFTTSITQTGEQAENLAYTQTSGNAWSLGTQSGSATQGVLAYENPKAYTVQFNQTGVPAGTSWYVNITGGVDLSGLGSSAHLSTSLGNGTYGWTASIGEQDWSATPNNGTFTVAGRTIYVNLRFAEETTYTVQFNQTGVPSTATWYVNITGGAHLSGRGSSASLETPLVNGTYPWTAAVGLAGWTSHPSSGSVHVTGKAVYVDLVFAAPPTYLVQFNQTGVPTGTYWYVNLSGNHDLSALGSSASVSVDLVNGSYPWTAAVGVVNWTVTPSSGEARVSGAAVYVDLSFAAIVTYQVQFNQIGAPTSAEWYVNLSGGIRLSASGASSSVSTYLGAGTYNWAAAVGETNWTVHPDSGTVVVSSSAVTVDLVISPPPTYTLEFSEKGVPAGTSWYVNLSSGAHLSAGGSTSELSVALPNGTYSYTSAIGAANWSVVPSKGPVDIQGAGRSVNLTFAPFTATVTFEATGLPSGTTWWVNVTSGPDLSGNGTGINASLDYGRHAYRIASANPEFAPSAYSGTVEVPSAGPVAVAFAPVTYSVSGVASYSGSGSLPVWTFVIGSHTASGEQSTVEEQLANGSYTFTASVAPGYTIAPASGTLYVHGGSQVVYLTISQNATGSSSSNPLNVGGTTLWIVLGLVGALLVGGVVALVVHRRRRIRRTERLPPPPTR